MPAVANARNPATLLAALRRSPLRGLAAARATSVKKCVPKSVIDAIKERWAAHDKSDHQREVHPNSAERRITGGASLAFCFAMLWINNTQVSDQRPCVSHASVTSCTIPLFCATSLYVSGLRFSARSIAMPGTVVVLGCGSPFCESTETCMPCAITQERNTSVAESQTVYAKFDPPCIAWIHP